MRNDQTVEESNQMKFFGITLGEVIDDQGFRYGDKPLVAFKNDVRSYQQVKVNADALAKALVDIGVGKGEHVAIWMPNQPEWVYTFFSVAKIGARLIPLNTRFKTHEVRYALAQSDASTFVIVDRFLNIDFAQMVYELCPELAQSQPEQFQSTEFSSLKRVICVSERSYNGMYQFAELLDRGKRRSMDLTSLSDHVKADEVAVIMYTSGTTAFPKGAMLKHGSLLQNAFYLGERWQVNENDCIFSPFPFYHGAGLTTSLLVALTHGATLWSMSRWHTEDAMETIQNAKCTIYVGPATTQTDILDHPNLGKYNLSSVKRAHATHHGSLGRNLFKRLGWEICGVYGLTESSPNVCAGDLSDSNEKRFSRGGKPFPGIEVRIIEPETGKLLSNGNLGEIHVRGWSIMEGYYNKPEETAKAIDKDGWLHTGDIGVMDKDGYLTFKGRLKDIIRCGGENVSPEEVEAFLLDHPKVHQVQIIGVRDARKGEVPMAFVEVKPDEKCTEQEIIDFCRSKIANFKIPKYVKFVTEWPLTHLGKIQKFELRRMVEKEG